MCRKLGLITSILQSAPSNEKLILSMFPSCSVWIEFLGENIDRLLEACGFSKKKAVHLSEILRKQGFSVRYEVAFGGLIVDNAFMNPHTAIENAALSDVNIVFAGTGAAIESEGYDRKHMKLSDVQERAILDTAAVNSNTVVVLFAGAPIDMSSWIDEVAAVVWAGFPGEKGDEAVADIFTGKAKSDRKTFGNVPAVLR